jgi:hypothetical protein
MLTATTYAVDTFHQMYVSASLFITIQEDLSDE